MKKRIFFWAVFVILVQVAVSGLEIRLIQDLNRLDLEKEYELPVLLKYKPENVKVFLNTAFARHGRPFKARRMKDLFQHTTWYKVNPAYKDSMLTETDKLNVKKIHSILYLKGDRKNLFARVKHDYKYILKNDPDEGLRIFIDRERENFVLSGKIDDNQKQWRSIDYANMNRQPVDTKISMNNYGREGWFIYNNRFYFFVREDRDWGMYEEVIVRRYIGCYLDTDRKIIRDVELLSVYYPEKNREYAIHEN